MEPANNNRPAPYKKEEHYMSVFSESLNKSGFTNRGAAGQIYKGQEDKSGDHGLSSSISCIAITEPFCTAIDHIRGEGTSDRLQPMLQDELQGRAAVELVYLQ